MYTCQGLQGASTDQAPGVWSRDGFEIVGRCRLGKPRTWTTMEAVSGGRGGEGDDPAEQWFIPADRFDSWTRATGQIRGQPDIPSAVPAFTPTSHRSGRSRSQTLHAANVLSTNRAHMPRGQITQQLWGLLGHGSIDGYGTVVACQSLDCQATYAMHQLADRSSTTLASIWAAVMAAWQLHRDGRVICENHAWSGLGRH